MAETSYSRAVEAFDTARQLDTSSTLILFNLGVSLLHLGSMQVMNDSAPMARASYTRALAIIDEVLRNIPAYPGALAYRGQALLGLAILDEEDGLYEDALHG